MEKPKKALMIYFQNNAVEKEDCETLLKAFERKGWETELHFIGEFDNILNIDEYPIEDFNFIGLIPSVNAIFQSGRSRKRTMQKIHEKARPGAITLVVCDTTIPVDPHMWDKGETSKEKTNIYSISPIKVLGSFSENVLEDQDAMTVIKRRWMKNLHPESTFIPLEWLSLHIDTLEESINNKLAEAEEETDEIFLNGIPEVKNFYYGISKNKVAKRLKSMGILEDSQNAVFGTISKDLPDVRSLDTGSNKKRGMEYWAPIARKAEGLYIPYDPVKGDYQFTKRFLECYLLNPDGLIIDPLIKPEIAKFIKPDSWREKADEVTDKLDEIY